MSNQEPSLAQLLTRDADGNVDEVVGQVMMDPTRIRELVQVMRGGKDPIIRVRAAEAVEKISRFSESNVQALSGVLLELSDADEMEIRWHVAQMIPRMVLEGENYTAAVDTLYNYLEDSSALVRVSAITSLGDLAFRDPDLKHNVRPLVEELAKTGSPSVRARCRKILKSFDGDSEN
jgi:hypothetical protein